MCSYDVDISFAMFIMLIGWLMCYDDDISSTIFTLLTG